VLIHLDDAVKHKLLDKWETNEWQIHHSNAAA
jgi:hypothetical protein